MKRLGVFGGSFDPVHFGHLLLAESCLEGCRLDEVWFVPTAVAPHKQSGSAATPDQRSEMLRLAVAGHEQLRVSEIEIRRGGISYTRDTLAALKESQPDAELFLLLGADSLVDLPHWRNPAEILALAIPAVARRHGNPPPDYSCLAPLVAPERLRTMEQAQFETSIIELSSSDLRQRVREGRSIRYRTPPAVAAYIQAHQLYRTAP